MNNFIGDLFSDFFDVASSDKEDSRSDLLVSGLALLAFGAMIGFVAYWFLSGLWVHIEQPVEGASTDGSGMNYQMAYRLAIPGGIAAIISLAMIAFGFLSLFKAAAMKRQTGP